ncbi:hypothetical protein M422DRAFT_48922 [Sphaerobolus stellatus SS14]|uniref:Uncharacterized protein n=1 Tax=Sphaerobolus stellatus (strain SS14) TaxID=990650 RepID=A0A0C9VSB7_SPHS4|nr:hypothetical protein M422DRAFT_48922 [Sphaerobolus stellatus SS14]
MALCRSPSHWNYNYSSANNSLYSEWMFGSEPNRSQYQLDWYYNFGRRVGGMGIQTHHQVSTNAIMIACSVTACCYMENAMDSFSYSRTPSPHITGCWADHAPNKQHLLPTYVTVISNETAIFLVMIARARHMFRHQTSAFIHTLFRDGLLYYFAALSESSAFLYLNKVRSSSFINPIAVSVVDTLTSNSFVQHIFHVVFMSRILVNLRKVSARCENRLVSSQIASRASAAANQMSYVCDTHDTLPMHTRDLDAA